MEWSAERMSLSTRMYPHASHSSYHWGDECAKKSMNGHELYLLLTVYWCRCCCCCCCCNAHSPPPIIVGGPMMGGYGVGDCCDGGFGGGYGYGYGYGRDRPVMGGPGIGWGGFHSGIGFGSSGRRQ